MAKQGQWIAFYQKTFLGLDSGNSQKFLELEEQGTEAISLFFSPFELHFLR